jgi:osmotically-inducible protein OsmY
MNKRNIINAIQQSYADDEAVIKELQQSKFDFRKLLKERFRCASIGRWSVIMLIAAGVQIAIFSPSQAADKKNKIKDSNTTSAAKKITDYGITSAVEDALILESDVFSNDVDVNTSQGIVTLSGSVDNLLSKDRAVKIAETIWGVRGVIDRIIITPVSRPDEDIRKDILTALLQDPATESYQVAVSVQGAVVTLTGNVGSYMEKQLSARIAKGVTGVKDVRNDVTINYQAKRTDKEIEADVSDRLQWDIWINGDLIYTSVKDGKVTLTGTVGSVIGMSRAFDDAWVNGVMSVDDSGLKVEPWAHNDSRKKLKFAIKSDSDIRRAVHTALLLDPRVSAFSPDVTVDGGWVRLGGIVGNLKAKTSADQDAKNTAGVLGVDNFLKVRPKEQSTDAEIKKQLTAALFWNPLLFGATINVTVTNRVVRLSGEVSSRFQKVEAQDAASRTKGVLSVHNHLNVEPDLSIYYDIPENCSYDWPIYSIPYKVPEMFEQQPTLSDGQIKKNIESRFFWSPFVDGDEITVTVKGGVATLTGAVGTWIGWGEADKDAHKSGATEVVNQVTVRKGAWWWQ